MTPDRTPKVTLSVPSQPPPPRPSVPPSYISRTVITVLLVISLVVGGIGGALVGTLVATNTSVSGWIRQNVYGQAPASVSGTGSTSTLTVTEDSATVDVVKKVSPAVVSIVISQDLSKIYNQTGPDISPFGNLFNFPQRQVPEGLQEVGAGSGFIISADGMILTNKHVVSTEGGSYTVVMNDGKKYDATVLATDPFNDLAVVKVDAKDLPVVELGNLDTLQIGQTVIAIGNALGEYRNTVTKGVISGLARTVVAGDGQGTSETLENIIQTDSAINSGNSGGPLLNLAGQVIGVNTAMNSSGQLIGFTIPINQAKKAIDSVQKTGKISRPYLGVRYVQIDDTIAKKNSLSVNYGALVVRGNTQTDLAVLPGSPADKAGIVENDIILEVNGQKIDVDHTLSRELQKLSVGDTVTLKIQHRGETKDITATLEEAKS
ncbi:MAG: trypsin-like peptidase domain-containing protein [Patescibacteria group bacterium]